MSFPKQTFLGATIKSFTTSASWGGGGSQLNMELVEDPDNGDRFNPPVDGAPVYLNWGGYRFAGLLQKVTEVESPDGKPTYSVSVVDPRGLLENAQVVVGAYSGPTHGVANLYNAYGYWESQGFGLSGDNEAGMPWNKVQSALTILTSSYIAPSYGTPISFKGYEYSLDLSGLPVPPNNYRVGGGAFMNLLELIDLICDDGGCDYLVDLVGSTIKIRTIARRNQPTLNTIPRVVNSNRDICLRRSYGREMRNETTSSFLIGGEQTSLFFSDAITSFWGFDTRGRPILGQIGTVELKGEKVPCDKMTLNSTGIADITGSFRYECNTVEMRHALGSQDLWMTYMKEHRTALANRIGIEAAFKAAVGAALVKKIDLLNVDDAADIASLVTRDTAVSRINRVYQFVLAHAEEYFGKQFFVRLPFVSRKVDPETTKSTTSYEIADSGFVPEGSSPLGVQPLFEDIFKNPDGRFRCFVRYNSASSADLSSVSPQGTIMQGDTLYVEADAHPVIFEAPQPGCVVRVSSPLFGKPYGLAGDIDLLAKTIGVGREVIQGMQTREHIPLETTPDCYWPTSIAVPLKSNILTYGPWYVAGAPGKVKVEHDSSLTPWNYGNYATMNAAGNAKVFNSLSNMQSSETGNIELAEIPRISIGQSLQAGGPYCTNVDVRMDGSGYTSNYRFETYTPKFGTFSKGQVERMRRMGLAGLAIRRNLAARARYQLAMSLQVNAAAASNRFFKNASKLLKQRSPHEVLVSHAIPTNNGTRITMQTASMEEALSLSNANNANWSKTAIMGLEGIMRPFTTATGGDGTLPGIAPTAFNGQIPDSKSLNPFGQYNGTDIISSGSAYTGLNAVKTTPQFHNARVIGLRGPLVIAGVGMDITTKPVPRETGDSTSFSPDAFSNPSKAMVGPLDAVWDNYRGCWSYHTHLGGTLVTEVVPGNGGSGEMAVETKNGTTWNQLFFNPYSSPISGPGTYMTIEYFAHVHEYRVTSFDCVSGD